MAGFPEIFSGFIQLKHCTLNLCREIDFLWYFYHGKYINRIIWQWVFLIIQFPVKNRVKTFLSKYVKFRSSIYSRVVYIITLSSIILFIVFGFLFRSVYEQNLNTVIRQNGNNIGSIVEGSLYHSMLENNKSTLQSTLDIINTMSGIDDVNMYDDSDRLVYSSFSSDSLITVTPIA